MNNKNKKEYLKSNVYFNQASTLSFRQVLTLFNSVALIQCYINPTEEYGKIGTLD